MHLKLIYSMVGYRGVNSENSDKNNFDKGTEMYMSLSCDRKNKGFNLP